MTNDNKPRQYDLAERTANFAIQVIQLVKSVRETTITKPIIIQLVRSATSIGANYCEADDAESKKDFKHKIGICKKEARETKYWIHILANADPEIKEWLKPLWKEAKELHLIFSAIIRSSISKKK